MAVDLNTLLSVFNGSKAIPKNDASYLVIKQLIISARELNQLITDAGSIEALGIGRFLAYGTAAERAAFQPIVIAGVLVLYYETDTQLLWTFSTDWEQVSGGITELIGDVTAGPGSGTQTATLSTTGVVAGTYGSNTQIPVYTVDSKGRFVSSTHVGISSTAGITELTGDVLAGPGTGSITSTLSTTGVSAGTYGSSTLSAVITVDAKGRLTSATTAANVGSGSYVLIASTTPTSSSITFSTLGSYTHLVAKISGRGDTTATAVGVNMRFNSDTGSNYDRQSIRTHNATNTLDEDIATTSVTSAINISGDGATAGLAGSGEVKIFDYRGTTFNKAGISSSSYKTSNASDNTNLLNCGWAWRSTAAITSITFILSTGNFKTGSVISLYGIS